MPGRKQASATQQFAAVLRKNFILLTRSRKTIFGLGGWAALTLQVLTPVAFFLLMCIPHYYLKPVTYPLVQSAISEIDDKAWAGRRPYEGPGFQRGGRAHVVLAPNTTNVIKLATVLAKTVACPKDPAKRNVGVHSFYGFFKVTANTTACDDHATCMATPECYVPLLEDRILLMSDAEAAWKYVEEWPESIDAIVDFYGPNHTHYNIRMNHTTVPSTKNVLRRFLVHPLDRFSPPATDYQEYWFFTNLQLSLDRAFLGLASHSLDPNPADVQVQVRPFPWPQKKTDIGAGVAASFFNLLLVYAFMMPCRGLVATIVREKELNLREGMRILGLTESAYWASWALTHWSTLAVSGLLVTIVGLYPFPQSSFLLMLAFYWLFAASLVAYSYFLTTLFSKSRVAGTAAQFIYALSMIPGFVLPSMRPYGDASWYWSCLLPPSAASIFAQCLLLWEYTAEGITLQTISIPIGPFIRLSALTVYQLLAADILLYSLLTWYLDKVMPGPGHQLPFYFPMLPSYWRGVLPSRLFRRRQGRAPADLESTTRPLLDLDGAQGDTDLGDLEIADDGQVAVRLEHLKKVFPTTSGLPKVAVDGISLAIERGRITALLGHNGAGKTTTIHMLTGMMLPTSGKAFIDGLDTATEMATIRHSLGVCPQFDILWPDITVREHLSLYAALKGLGRDETASAAQHAAEEVGLREKLDVLAGELSGGQKRKLSVAIAFMGDPRVVFLDEPTSGMDPYSRRFTWDVIRAHRAHTAVVLTTHSMEEADVLCDQVIVMADGRIAAQGTTMDLKSRYGVGYTLTIITPHGPGGSGSSAGSALASPTASPSREGVPPRPPSVAGSTADTGAAQRGIHELVCAHVAGAELLSCAGAEMAYRLPKEESGHFAELLRALEGSQGEMGVVGYGLSVTTLEEVFLAITSASGAEGAGGGGVRRALGMGSTSSLMGQAVAERSEKERLSGLPLYLTQLRALLTKRALCARRDRLAVVTQLVVPLLLVLIALWTSNLSFRPDMQPALPLTRSRCLMGRPAAVAVDPSIRANSSADLQAFLSGYSSGQYRDTGMDDIWRMRFRPPPVDTLDGWLLNNWYSGIPAYDALFLQQLPPPADVARGEAAVKVMLYMNLSTPAALPGSLGELSGALLRYVGLDLGAGRGLSAAGMPPKGLGTARVPGSEGGPGEGAEEHGGAGVGAKRKKAGGPRAQNWPLPVSLDEMATHLKQNAASLMLVLCISMASSVLSASFVVYLVRESESASKHVQLVSGAPPTAFWLATYAWDLLNFSIPAVGIILLFRWYDLPAYSGPRLSALAALLWTFSLAALPLTYLLHFLFKDEMKALQRLNTLYFLTAYLGFLATWILDLIYALIQPKGIHKPTEAAKALLRLMSPHYCLAKGVYDIAQTYQSDLPILPHKAGSPWGKDVFGTAFTHMMIQALVYSALVLVTEAGLLSSLYYRLSTVLHRTLRQPPKTPSPPQHLQFRTSSELQLPETAPSTPLILTPPPHPFDDLSALPPLPTFPLRISSGTLSPPVTPQAVDAATPTHFAHTPTTALPQDHTRPLDPSAPLHLTVVSTGHLPASPQEEEDEYVRMERQAVEAGLLDNAQVLLEGVVKGYSQGLWRPPVKAVRGIWVGVPEGQCFGLLGVNGAGKTTTFRMLTGEVSPDEGDAHICGHSVRLELVAARRHLGYCPQFDGLPRAMTGREVLTMYARLRGVPGSEVVGAVSELLARVGLSKQADNECGSYSGGNKRKLSVGVALVGEPRVVLLDEPSTGMDPGARRALWTLIQQEVIGAGRTVVLTSHSMEECEALCGRIGIMVGGRFKCLGSNQLLKSRYGEGYTLELRVDSGDAAAAAALEAVKEVCPEAKLVEEEPGRMVVGIGGRQGMLPDVFRVVEGRREELGIVDYSLSQTTLEQVFVGLAKGAERAEGGEHGGGGS